MSPCVKTGELECLYCHTSSGRYRFKTEKYNDACMPCHKEKVKNIEAHTHHAHEGAAGKCIACHMPQTDFARMTRSDHSMRPPMPAATIAFGSPNACNICHPDKNAEWADNFVKKWKTRDYQAPVLHISRLIDSARKNNWHNLNDMLSYIIGKDRDEVYATSLIRLVRASNDPAILPAMITASKDASPLIRSAAIESLGLIPSMEGLREIIKATGDKYRLVRVHAAGSLAGFQKVVDQIQLSAKEKKDMEKAKGELLSFLLSRPDQWSSHYNMGNYHLESGDLSAALTSYEKALRLEPHSVPVMVNMSMVHARNGQNIKAEESLRKALEIEPENSTVNYNLGLLLAELGNTDEAEKTLRTSFRSDPKLAPAAYNLCVLLEKDRKEEAIGFCKKAYDLRPDEAKYAYTLAFYQHQKGDTTNAIKVLKQAIAQNPSHTDASLLLADIYKGLGKKEFAKNVYQNALSKENISMQDRYRIEMELEKLMNENKTFRE
jgi:Tfp pilus assembly protein PilF